MYRLVLLIGLYTAAAIIGTDGASMNLQKVQQRTSIYIREHNISYDKYYTLRNHDNNSKVSFDAYEDCPTWMYRSNNSTNCKCGVDNHYTVKCDESINRVYVLDSYAMTFDDKHQEVVVGASIYGTHYSNVYDIYHPVPINMSQINEVVCSQYNRKGRLCGECKEGYSPLVYSYSVNCKQCSDTENKYNILKFIGVAFLPLTVFYFVVVLFKFNANSPKLHGFILFAQLASAPFTVRVVLIATSHKNTNGPIMKAALTFYSFWNLDFFRTLYPDMCLKVTTLQALALDYVIAFYPLLLMLLTLVAFKLHSHGYRIVLLMWYPFHKCFSTFRRDQNNKTSMIDVFATFLLLSYCRIMSVSFNLLIYTSIVNSRGEFLGRYLYYDASYEFFAKEHLPYGIMALFLFTTFNILPLLLLLFYPMNWFQKCLNWLRLSHVALHTFVDSFAGCYKDGTEPGTRDCRYFAALYLLVRLVYYIVYEVTLTEYFYGMTAIIITGVLLLYMIFLPYKPKFTLYNKVTATMISLIIMTLLFAGNVCIAVNKFYLATNFTMAMLFITVILPQLYIIGVAIHMTGVCNFIKVRFRLSKFVHKREDPSEESLLGDRDSRENNCLYHTASLN